MLACSYKPLSLHTALNLWLAYVVTITGKVNLVTLEQLPVPEGVCRKDGEGLFTRVCSDRTRGEWL